VAVSREDKIKTLSKQPIENNRIIKEQEKFIAFMKKPKI
jgi:hypothetical protein